MNQAVLNDIDAIIPRLYPPTCAVQFNHCELERTTLAVEKPIISFCAVDVKIMQLYFHRNEAFLCSLCHLSAAAHAKLVPKGGNYGKPLCNHLWVRAA